MILFPCIECCDINHIRKRITIDLLPCPCVRYHFQQPHNIDCFSRHFFTAFLLLSDKRKHRNKKLLQPSAVDIGHSLLAGCPGTFFPASTVPSLSVLGGNNHHT
ncbi:hypothetical protein AVEN_8999-1 [Araneus ventricosus]|uniref:Uncharacterized protein n=1 Tax=Araneus ventricosus TaxID=182803 RepID=A0A4Y2DSL6_ARAVE|nr:hypothetical protein AVEN_8999-1 [Araneus ventricosus]